MNAIVEKALGLWGLAGASYTLAAARENAVYRVVASDRVLAVRLHRQGYRTDRELWSELAWMDVAAQGGLQVPSPIHSADGSLLHTIDGVQVDVLTWLAGIPLADCFDTFGPEQRKRVFTQIGGQMGRLHQISDAWELPKGFQRCAWDKAGLIGSDPLWGRFWDNPSLSPQDRELFLKFRDAASAELSIQGGPFDYGLIHADLVAANVLVDGDQLNLIDFDDGGFGFRLFEIATTLLKFIDAPDYPNLHQALVTGYSDVRTLNSEFLELFLTLRALTYVGWNITRMHEPDGRTRNARFINTARRLTTRYLASA